MITAVSFDLDNTIYPQKDYEYSVFRMISLEIEREYGVNHEEFYGEVVNLFNRGERNLVFDKAILRFLKDLPEGWKDFVKNRILPIYRSSKVDLKPFDGVVKILEKLRKKLRVMVIITDGNVDLQMNKIELLGIRYLFDKIYISDDYNPPARKPDTRMFKDFLDDFHLNPSDTMHVGDDEIKDGACQKLGMKFFHIRSSEDWLKLNYLLLP